MTNEKLNAKTIEALAFIARKNEINLMDFYKRGIDAELITLYDLGLVSRKEFIGDDQRKIFYSINSKGKKYFEDIFDYANKNYPK